MKIDPGSNVPIYIQVVREIQSRIAAGIYVEGERIPSANDLAVEFRVNPNTVHKALSELTEMKVVKTRRGLGRFVAKRKMALKQAEEAMLSVFAQGIQIGCATEMPQRRIRQLFNQALADGTTSQKATG